MDCPYKHLQHTKDTGLIMELCGAGVCVSIKNHLSNCVIKNHVMYAMGLILDKPLGFGVIGS